MIARIWHGAVPEANKKAFADYLEQNYTQRVRGAEGNAAVYVRTEESGGWTHFYTCSIWYCIEDIYEYAGGDINAVDVVEDDDKGFGLIGDPCVLNMHVRDTQDPLRQAPVVVVGKPMSVCEAKQRIVSIYSEGAEYEPEEDGQKGRIWQLFSREQDNCVRGEYAREAFDLAEKQNAMLFRHDMSDTESIIRLDDDSMTSEEVEADSASDVYVIGESFLWIYARPSNAQFGPYFAYICNHV